jgi:hypothetical protein
MKAINVEHWTNERAINVLKAKIHFCLDSLIPKLRAMLAVWNYSGSRKVC